MISFRAMTLSLAIALVGGAASAQQAPAKPSQAQPSQNQTERQGQKATSPGEDDQQALMDAQRRVLEAQQKALEDPALQKDLEELQQFVEAQMIKQDKSVKAKLDRLETLQGQLEKMQAAETPDPEKAAPLVQEAQQIAGDLAQVQTKVVEQPEVKKRLEVFDKKLRAEMKQIDPEVPSAIAKLEAASRDTASP